MSTELTQTRTTLPSGHHAKHLFGGLTKRESAFVDFYLANPTGNASEAAKLAGFTGKTESLWQTGSRLLRRVKVRQEIMRRLGTHVADSTEVLELLTKHARGDLTDVLTPTGEFDFKVARKKRLLKKLKVKKRYEKDADGNLQQVIEQEFEIHDPQAALEKLGRFHKLFADKSDSEVNLSDSSIEQLLGKFCAVLDEAQRRRELSATTIASSEAGESSQSVVDGEVLSGE